MDWSNIPPLAIDSACACDIGVSFVLIRDYNRDPTSVFHLAKSVFSGERNKMVFVLQDWSDGSLTKIYEISGTDGPPLARYVGSRAVLVPNGMFSREAYIFEVNTEDISPSVSGGGEDSVGEGTLFSLFVNGTLVYKLDLPTPSQEEST